MTIKNITSIPAEVKEKCELCESDASYLTELSDGKSMILDRKCLESVYQTCNMVNYFDRILSLLEVR